MYLRFEHLALCSTTSNRVRTIWVSTRMNISLNPANLCRKIPNWLRQSPSSPTTKHRVDKVSKFDCDYHNENVNITSDLWASSNEQGTNGLPEWLGQRFTLILFGYEIILAFLSMWIISIRLENIHRDLKLQFYNLLFPNVFRS